MSEAMEPAQRPRRPGARPLWTAVAALLLGAGALWGSSRLTWLATHRELPVRGTVPHFVTGAEHAPALVPLAVLAVAGIAGLIATSGWPRRVLGVLLALAGVGAVWLGVGELSTLFAEHPADYPLGEIILGRALALSGGLLVVVAGVLVAVRGSRMPRLGARYQAPAAARENRDPDKEMWQALSEGEDPTARD